MGNSYNKGELTKNKIRLGGKTEKSLSSALEEGLGRHPQPQPIYNGWAERSI
jgi:hypothetical protein